MNPRSLSQLSRLARTLFDESRRAQLSATSELEQVEEGLRVLTEQRAIVLSGAAGLSAQTVADCVETLDHRERKLMASLDEARDRVATTRRRALAARRELRTLERLGELREARAERESDELEALESSDLNNALRHGNAVEDEVEALV